MGAYLSQPKTEKETSLGEDAKFCYGVSAMQGWRVDMEDAHAAILNIDDANSGFFAVFDGHGGKEVAKFAAVHVARLLVESEAYKSNDVPSALSGAYLGLDELLSLPEHREELLAMRGPPDEEDEEPTSDDRGMVISGSSLPPSILAALGLGPDSGVAIRLVRGAGAGGLTLEGLEAEDDEEGEEEEEAEEETEAEAEGYVAVARDAGRGRGGGSGEPQRRDSSAEDSEDASGDASAGDAKAKAKRKREGAAAKAARGRAERGAAAVPADAAPAASPPAVASPFDAEADETVPSRAEQGSSAYAAIGAAGNAELGTSPVTGDDPGTPPGQGEADYVGPSAGCTAVAAVLRAGRLTVANAGDSRCVLSRRGGVALALTRDHKPDDPAEYARIMRAGGFVADGRVNGSLNLSRALGDMEYKQAKELSPAEQSVTALPEVRSVELQQGDEFLILACDGIWDVLTVQEAVDFVRERLLQGTTPAKVCEEVCNRCLAPDTDNCGKGCDNMSVIIVVLKEYGFPEVIAASANET